MNIPDPIPGEPKGFEINGQAVTRRQYLAAQQEAKRTALVEDLRSFAEGDPSEDVEPEDEYITSAPDGEDGPE